MAASDPSKYDKINLEASDQSETVDLRLADTLVVVGGGVVMCY